MSGGGGGVRMRKDFKQPLITFGDHQVVSLGKIVMSCLHLKRKVV